MKRSELASIDESVRAIAGHLERLRRPSAKLLRPGLTRAAIAEVETTLPFRLTADLVALYRATDGVPARRGDDLDRLHVFPGYRLLPLADAARAYRQVRRARPWKPGWFPLFGDDAGDYYAVACAPRARGVIGYLRGEPEQPVEYASIAAMLATLVRCFAEAAFVVKRGRFDIVDDAHRRIAIELNPGVRFWRDEDDAVEASARRQAALALATAATKQMSRDPRGALARFETALATPDLQPFAYVNALYAMNLAIARGRVASARIRVLLAICLASSRPSPDLHLNAAFGWMALGEHDRCLEALRTAKNKGVDLTRHLRDPIFARLAGDRRFESLRRTTP